MAWCEGALDCLPWVGGGGYKTGGGYKAVSTVNDDECVAAGEQSTTWADGSTLHLDGTVSAELLRETQSHNAQDVSVASNLDAKTEAWLSGACAALDDITSSPLSAGSRSDRSSLSAEIAAALNTGVSRVMSAISTTSSVSESPITRASSSRPAPSPCFSSHPSRVSSKHAHLEGERAFGTDRTNSLTATGSSEPNNQTTTGKQTRRQHQQPVHASPVRASSQIAPPPSSPATE
jgi:hypothetical protein